MMDISPQSLHYEVSCFTVNTVLMMTIPILQGATLTKESS